MGSAPEAWLLQGLSEGVQVASLLPFHMSTLPLKWDCSFVAKEVPGKSCA